MAGAGDGPGDGLLTLSRSPGTPSGATPTVGAAPERERDSSGQGDDPDVVDAGLHQ